MTEPIKILSGGAMRGLLNAAEPLFERAGGAKLDVRFALSSVLAKDIEAGTDFDIAILPRPELDALARAGKVEAGTCTDIARSAVGLCVRTGAPRPDIGTVAAFKRTLIEAGSLGYSDGPSGAYVADLLQRLGIAAHVQPKAKLTSGPVAALVAGGEAEIGIQQIVAILPVEGAELVGPLPGALQNIIVYAAGISPQSANAEQARGFIRFMRTPEAARIMRVKGLQPG